MYKRVERKRKRREEEEELGLDGDMKEIMGLNDTDSDETASESDSDASEREDEGSEGPLEIEEDDEDEDDEISEDDESGLPAVTVQEALKDPIYLVSLDPDVTGCILCKGKLIKSLKMGDVHKKSMAHQRRFKRFKTLAQKARPSDDAWPIAKAAQTPATNDITKTPETLSNRAQKRKVKLDTVKEKRQRQKVMKAKAKAKKEAKALVVTTEEPAEEPTEEQPSKGLESSRKKRKLGERTRELASPRGKEARKGRKFESKADKKRPKVYEERITKKKSSKPKSTKV